MIRVDLNDMKLKENLEAMNYLRKTGLYTDEQLQKMYDEQVKKDKEKLNENHTMRND
jgi:hypothetical protein